MAALPLTLDTLQTPDSESITLQTPLMSPQQCLKADSSSLSSVAAAGHDMMETPERPSNLTLETTHHQQQQQQQHQQQHSNVTPSHGNISPALSSAGSLSPSFLPEMPQWKRDLIQRRKHNVQRTISASSPSPSAITSLSSSSPATIAMAIGGLKTSTSSSSVRSLAGSNTNIDQLASDGLQQVCSTKDYIKTSLSSYANATTKVNKQYITTTTTTNTKPANNIKSCTKTLSSPLKEKAEKLFGGQYTATTPTSLLSSSTSLSATFATKEEITTSQRLNKECKVNIQQENNEMTEENQQERFEKMYSNTNKLEEEEEVLNDETQNTTAIITNKQQLATRLTGSSYNTTTATHNTAASSSSTSSSSSSSSTLKRGETERENLLNSQPYHNNICVGNLQNQSLNKCESERLVCAANTTNITNITGNSINFNNNTNNSVTIGGIIVGSSSGNASSVVKISQKLQENQFIKNEQHLNIKKLNKFKQNTTTASGGGNISLDLKSPTKTTTNVLTTSNSYSCLTSATSFATSSSTLAAVTSCTITKKMVAVQEMKKSTQTSATHLHPITSTCQATNRANNRSVGTSGGGAANDLDNNEDLSYGPGIVSKLRCRYLSLALRESMEQQRLNKDKLRRSTSLNNLLDNNEDEENCDDDEEEEEDLAEDEENQGFNYKNIRQDPQNGDSHNLGCKKMGILKTSVNNGQEKRFSSNTQGSNGVGVTFTETSYNKRSRHLKRGNDSLKRARSVEALLSEKSPWHTRANSSTPTCITIEDKIHNARERLQQGIDHLPPKRLTSIIDDTERPPPDLVKQTLKMFEATANRRPRTNNRSNSKGDVASKVETFKNIIKEQKPVITYPKPLSPTKKLQKPLKTATPQAQDLLQSPLGRKVLATATSVINSQDCLTPLKANQTTLSEHTPDIIPRQKFNNERDFKQNKEIFNSKEKLDTPLSSLKRDLHIKEKFEVDSPLTALTKELGKLKLNDTTPTRKTDNCSATSSSDNHESMNNKGSSVGGVGGSAGSGDNNGGVGGGDACQRQNNKYPYNNDFKNEETQQELNNISSLKNENDKINNKNTKPNNNEQATSSTIETKNELATVNNYECLTKAASPPPSSSDLSDGGENYDDDEYGGLKTTKRITRTALDNIAKAGYTQQFKFNTNNSSTNSTINTTISTSSSTSSSSTTSLNTGKQIGVIRPLLNTQQQKTSADTTTNMETLKHSTPTSLTSREIEKNRINDLKKSSNNSPTANSHNTNTQAANSSPSSASQLDHVIKTTHNTSPASGASSVATAAGYSDVDSVISATNSPLWAMRKRRQAPPAAPAENTSMVFNFSNRKEVPDYIENDGVIFRRKRELPKPNESGFVLLGDLSVETSTDMDYDDFSMCPPSPCDVEFVNANIVIDGKSNIRQKSKDTAFRVQFNDTLTSTFEYPSEASLIVDDSFSAYNESYTQPLGSSSSAPDDFTQAFQNLCLENATTHHHVADEIIQLPTLNASTPAATANNTNTPTKNILGNLPLDYPDLQKVITLTTAATAATVTQPDPELANTDQKKLRKDLKLPLGQQQSLLKPPLPVKRIQLKSPAAAGAPAKLFNSKNLPRNSPRNEIKEAVMTQPSQRKEEEPKEELLPLPLQRKTPRVLNKPQYACFLQEPSSAKPPVKHAVQRSRSNEFQKTFSTFSNSNTVSRSNSLRSLENQARSQFNTTGPTALLFPAEVNSKDKPSPLSSKKAFVPNPQTPPENTCNYKNFCELETFFELKAECKDLSQSLNNLVENSLESLKTNENLCKSVESFSLKQSNRELTGNFEKQETQSLENFKKIWENFNNKNKNVSDNKGSTENLTKIVKNLDNSQDIPRLNDFKQTTCSKFELNDDDGSKNSNKITKQDKQTKNINNCPAMACATHLKRVASLNYKVNNKQTKLAALNTVSTKIKQNLQDSAINSEDFTQIRLKSIKSTAKLTKSWDNVNENDNLGNFYNKNENSPNKSLNSLNLTHKTQNLAHDLESMSKKLTKSLENLSTKRKTKDADEALKNSLDFNYKTQNLSEDLSYTTKQQTKSLENLFNTKKTIKVEEQQTNFFENSEVKGNLLKSLEISQKTKDLQESFNENLLKVKEIPNKSIVKVSSAVILNNTLANNQNLNDSPTKSVQSLKFNLNNCVANKQSLNNAPLKSVKSLSSIFPTNYSSEYDGKIVESVSQRETKSMENLTQANSQDSLSLSVTADNLKEYSQKIQENLTNKNHKFVNVKWNKDLPLKSKSQDNLSINTSTLFLKNCSVSNENFCDFIEYFLFRNIESDEGYDKKPEIPEVLFNGETKSQNKLCLTEHMHKLKSNSVDDNIDLEVKKRSSHSKSLDNIDLRRSIDTLESIVYSKVVSLDDTENVLKSQSETKEFESLTADTNTLQDNACVIPNLTKSLQMSLDSLEALEDTEEYSSKNLHASEILEDIPIGLNSNSQYDFNNLLTLKRTKTEYCLQSLDKSSSEDTPNIEDSSYQLADNSYLSACNTLQSKWSSKANEETKQTNPESVACLKPVNTVPKKPKTLRIKTTEKILNFTNMATHNVSSYSTFRKSKIFCKNASKTFKNSLRFYETFSEKSLHNMPTPPSPIKRSLSLPDNVVKRPELNRKLFAKSGKIKMKGSKAGEWYSPTENSYSFDYYDAAGDINGKLVKQQSKEIGIQPELIKNSVEKDVEENFIKTSLEIEATEENVQNFLENPLLTFKESSNNSQLTSVNVNLSHFEENFVKTENVANEISAHDSNLPEAMLISDQTLNLKPLVYEATTLVYNEQTSRNPKETKEDSMLAAQYENFPVLTKSLPNLKPFELTHELDNNFDNLKETSVLAENSGSLAAFTRTSEAETLKCETVPFKTSSVSVFSVNTSKFQTKSLNSAKPIESTNTFFDNSKATRKSCNSLKEAGSKLNNFSIVTTCNNLSAATIEGSLPYAADDSKRYGSFNAGSRNVAKKVESFSKNNLNPFSSLKFSENSSNFQRVAENSLTNNCINQESKKIDGNSQRKPNNFSKFPVSSSNSGNLFDFPPISISKNETSLVTKSFSEIPNDASIFSANSQAYSKNSSKLSDNSQELGNSIASNDSLESFQITKSSSKFSALPENSAKLNDNSPELGNSFYFTANSIANEETSSGFLEFSQISNNSDKSASYCLKFPENTSQIPYNSQDSGNLLNYPPITVLNHETSQIPNNSFKAGNLTGFSTAKVEKLSLPSFYSTHAADVTKVCNNSSEFVTNSLLKENLANSGDKPKEETLSANSYSETNTLSFIDNSTQLCSNSLISENGLNSSPNKEDSTEFSLKLKKFSLRSDKLPDNSQVTKNALQTETVCNSNITNSAKFSFKSWDSFKIPNNSSIIDNFNNNSENSTAKFLKLNENNINTIDSFNNTSNCLDSFKFPNKIILNKNSSASKLETDHKSFFKTSNNFANSLMNQHFASSEQSIKQNAGSPNLSTFNTLNSSNPQFCPKKFINKNQQFTTTPTPTTTTLTVKDFNNTTTTTECSTTITTTSTHTNFPTKVVALYNLQQQPTNISYTNSSSSYCSSLSSLRHTIATSDTAKYQQNQKATTVTPAPPLKKLATINPPKVLPRRLFVNARTATTTMTSTTSSTTSSSTCTTTTTTTSSTCFKTSATNNNAPSPLRRRIPGNTLYYV